MKRKDGVPRHQQLGIFRNSEYRVILYAKEPSSRGWAFAVSQR